MWVWVYCLELLQGSEEQTYVNILLQFIIMMLYTNITMNTDVG